MKNNIYHKLIDLYAARELPEDLDRDMEAAAIADPEMAIDMMSLRQTVDSLKLEPEVRFTEESYQRVLMKIYARGAEIHTQAPQSIHLQYQLPMQG